MRKAENRQAEVLSEVNHVQLYSDVQKACNRGKKLDSPGLTS